jgi:Fe-S cluster assembly protein SufD
MSTTPAQESLVEAYRSRRSELPGAEVEWVQDLRARALDRFSTAGLPTGREEAWRHTSLAPISGVPFRPGTSGSMTGEVSAADLGMGYRVDIDGTDTNVSATPPLPKGLRIRPLRESAGDAREWLGRLADIESPGVSALNTALFDRGVWVEIAPGTVLEHPVHLVHALGADSEPSAAFPRVLVVAGKGTKSVIVEQYAGTAGNARLTAPVSEIHVGENAHLDHIRVQEESGEAFHVGRVVADQSAGSRFRSWSFALGAKLARVDVEARLRGEAAECSLEGIFAGLDGQHLDHYTRIDHVSPNTTSRETYKGILGGRARGVFLGHILVRPDAQKINAAQTSRSIVLSRGARVNMKPWLEIYADDVACTHGTTVGRLDEDALFYLRSRGIDRETSRAILVRAFAQEVLVGLPLEDLRDRLDQFLLGWLSEAA